MEHSEGCVIKLEKANDFKDQQCDDHNRGFDELCRKFIKKIQQEPSIEWCESGFFHQLNCTIIQIRKKAVYCLRRFGYSYTYTPAIIKHI